jgi:hypothetical protein
LDQSVTAVNPVYRCAGTVSPESAMRNCNMRRLAILLAFFLVALPALAQDSPRLRFVSEFITDLCILDDISAAAARDAKLADANPLMEGIRYSRRTQLEMQTRIGILREMRLEPPLNGTLQQLAALHQARIDEHERLIEIATEFASGPKPGVDYAKLSTEMPQIRAKLEFNDELLFKMAPLVFGALIDDREDKQGHVSHLIITKQQRSSGRSCCNGCRASSAPGSTRRTPATLSVPLKCSGRT